MKVLLKRFHLNGNTIGFHPQTQKLELRTKQIVTYERIVEEVSLEWSHHRISSIGSIVARKTNSTKPSESTAEEVSLNNRELLLQVLIT